MLVIDAHQVSGIEQMPLSLLSSNQYEPNPQVALQGNVAGLFDLGIPLTDSSTRDTLASFTTSPFIPILSIQTDVIRQSMILQSGQRSSTHNTPLTPDQPPAPDATSSQRFRPFLLATDEHLSLSNLGGLMAVGLLLLLFLGALAAASRISPSPEFLTIEQAADLLNVSESYMAKLLERGAIPFSQVGGHVHIQQHDLLAYKEQRDAKRHKALEEIVRVSEEMGLYDMESHK